MSTRDDKFADMTDQVRELTQPIRHAAPYDYRDPGHRRRTRIHMTTVPGLLQQVREAINPQRAGDGVSVAAPYASRCPGRMEALDTLIRVSQSAQGWLEALGVPIRTSAEDNVKGLLGAAGGLSDKRFAMVARDIGSWHRLCRVTTGWDAPPWRPLASCPNSSGTRLRPLLV